MHSGHDEQRQAVIDDLKAVGVLHRYRLLLLGASDEKAAGRLLPFLIVFIMLPVGVGALVETYLGVWTFAVVFAVFVLDVWLFLKVLRWAGLHGLTIARLRNGTYTTGRS
ncbi:MAG: hypothetical protein AAGI68_05290 [Planctomycetota bacterium]